MFFLAKQVMPPLEGKYGTPAVLLFGQGASIPTEMYEPLGLALQEAAPFPLWFASPQCLSNGGFVCTNMGKYLRTGEYPLQDKDKGWPSNHGIKN